MVNLSASAAVLWPTTRQTRVDGAVRTTEAEIGLNQLLERAKPLGQKWATSFDAVWSLEEHVRASARAWSTQAAAEVVRHLRTPYGSVAAWAAVLLLIGGSNLVTAALLAPRLGWPATVLVGAAGLLVMIHGSRVAIEYFGALRQYKAGIPPFRKRLQTEIERHAIAALERRRVALAGPRRPIPRHPFEELLPIHARNIAAAWMRHLGQLDAVAIRPDDTAERIPGLESEQVHLSSSGYVGRVWSFSADTPETELSLLEEAARVTGRRPLLFSRSPFPDAIVARSNRRGIALLRYSPWQGTITSGNYAGERCLTRGLRTADGVMS